jgi:hypothetical protein
MTAGEKVFVALPVYGAGSEPKGHVTEGTVVAEGERGEVVVKASHGGIYTYGGPFSDSKVFATEGEAWGHCAAVLRRRAAQVSEAAEACEARLST